MCGVVVLLEVSQPPFDNSVNGNGQTVGQLHLLVSYTTPRPTLQPHCLLKDAVCPTCHHLTSSSPSSTRLGRLSPSVIRFCSKGRSGGRITRWVLPIILSFILTNLVVSGSPSPSHPAKSWVRAPNTFNRFVGRTTILFVPAHLLPRVHLACHSTTRILCGAFPCLRCTEFLFY